MSDFRVTWVAPDGTTRRLIGPGALRGLEGGTIILHGTPEYQYEAGSWCDAVSTYVLRRRGQIRWAK